MADRIALLDLAVDPVTRKDLLSHALTWAKQPEQRTIMYANVHVANTAARDVELRRALHSADLVYCDGWGVKLGARLAGSGRLPERMTGADFIWELVGRLAEGRVSIYWLGGQPGVADEALRRLGDASAGLRVAGAYHGYFHKDGAESDKVVAAINDSRAELLFVGLGTPIQERWVARNRERITAKVVWCIGATADFVAGTQPRGPRVLTEFGFEWLRRLAVAPRRMFGRYVVGNPLFVCRALARRLERQPAALIPCGSLRDRQCGPSTPS